MDRSQDSSQPDVFHIRVLSIISPQDFWIQKIPKDPSDTDKTVIRAGIYGLFPARTQYVQQKDEFTVHKTKYWTNTTKIWFSKYMENITDDILFAPKAIVNTEYSTDGLSPICMYGEVYIQKNGRSTRLLNVLHNQRLAYKSDTQFERYLKEDRIPAILTQEDISLVKWTITKVFPDFKVGDHILYRRQQMKKYRPVGSRDDQAKVAKETMTVALRYFQRSKQEIDAILKQKEDDWNITVEDADEYETVYSRKTVIEKRLEVAQTVPMKEEEFTVLPEIAEIDPTEICESYSLHPPGISVQNQVILKKNKHTPGKYMSTPEKRSPIGMENISKQSPHLAESTPEDKSSFSSSVTPDFLSCDMSKSLENYLNDDSHSDNDGNIDRSIASRKVSHVNESDISISSERLVHSDFSEHPKTSSDDGLDYTENSSSFKIDGSKSLESDSPKKSLPDRSKQLFELPPLWVEHQDKDINEKTAAELKNRLGAADIKNSSIHCNEIENNEIINATTSFEINNCDDSNVRGKYIILKDTIFSDDDNDPDIVEDEFYDDHFNSTASSVASHESSLSGKLSFSKNQLLINPRSMYNIVWNANHNGSKSTDNDNYLSVAGISSDVSSAKNDNDTIDSGRGDKETIKVLNDIHEEDDTGGAICSIPPSARTETTNPRLTGMGLVERIIEPKVLMHSPNRFNVGLWTTIMQSAFPKRIRDCLTEMKIKLPNRLQTAAWPAMMRGHSCTIVGPANSGKTLGVLAPLCSFIADFEHDKTSNGPIGLVIVPNIKTALAVYNMCCCLLRGTKLNGKSPNILRVFSMAHSYTVLKVSEGCDILIMTSTAFLEFSDSKLSVLDLSRLNMLVFDDADVLYSQYNDDVNTIYSRCCSDKNLQFQVALTAKTWMEQFRPLIKTLDIPIVCISAFQECILYSKVDVLIKMALKNRKSAYLIELLKNRSDTDWKLVILCVNDEEVSEVYETLKSLRYSVDYLNTQSNLEDVRNAHRRWDFENLQALVCCDMNLSHINVMNATWLISYSLPNKLSTFNMRFVTMMDSYPNMFVEDLKVPLRIDVLVGSDNSEQLPKIINFISRCGTHIPDDIKCLSEKIFNLQDKARAYKGIELCDDLLSFGKCDDLAACHSRHSIIDKDRPVEWMPSSGTVVFKVLAVHRPDLLSVQLIHNVSSDGTVEKYRQKNIEIAFKLTAYFAVEDNVRAHGNVEVNDIAAIRVSTGTSYERCQVVKICTKNSTGGPDTIIVNLLEMETLLEAKAYNLYYLPDDLKSFISHVVRVRITGIKPSLGNISWSDSSIMEANKILTGKSNNLFTRGNIVLVIGKTLFFQTIQCCQKMKTEELVEVKLNYCEHLTTNRYACENPGHLVSLRRLCDKFNYKYPTNHVSNVGVKKPTQPEPQWAHLNENEYHEVYISSIVTPDQLFIQVVKQHDLLDGLVKDLQVYAEKRRNDLIPRHKRADWNFEIGTYCMAKFSDDELFSRARIDKILENKTVSSPELKNSYECFFVDFGDWRIVDLDDLCPISLELIKRLPFLAIECRLLGLKPKQVTWSEVSSDLLYDLSLKDNSGDLKLFYARFHKKETADITLGSKYAVLLYEINNLINNALLDKDLAVDFDEESIFIEDDKKDLEKWLSLQGSNNVIDDDFEIVSDQANPVPDFLLKSDKNISSSSSFSDLSDADTNKLIPFRANRIMRHNDLHDLDFSLDNWDCNFDDEDSKLVTENSQTIPGANRLGGFPIIMEDFEHINDSTDTRKQATIAELVEIPDLKDVKVKNVSKKQNNKIQPVLAVAKYTDEDKFKFRIPHVTWYQTEKEVILKINLIGVQKYSLIIDKNSVSFKTVHDNVNYEFKLDLFNGIVIKNSSHRNVGSYILVKLAKLRCVSWYQLFKGIDQKFSWISYNHDHIDDACDDEDIENTRLAKEAMREKVELIQRVYQIEMDGEDSDDEIVSNDKYSSKMKRMQREVMPFEPDDVYPDMKVLAEPLDFE